MRSEWSGTHATPPDADRLWQAYLRHFDIEHTFRMFKQTLGWICPKIRTPEAADRWTWLILAADTQLRLARTLAADLRRPGRNPVPRTDSLPPASAATCGTSAHKPLARPEHRKPPAPAPDGHRAERTPGPHPATTCTHAAKHNRRNDERRAQPTRSPAAQVKDHVGRAQLRGPGRRCVVESAAATTASALTTHVLFSGFRSPGLSSPLFLLRMIRSASRER